MRSKLLLLVLLVALTAGGCTRQAKINRAIAQGNKYVAAGQLERAKITFLSVLRSDGQNSEAIRQLGLIWAEEGAPLESIRYLLKAHEIAPKDDDVQERLASSLLAAQQFDPARKNAEELLNRSPARIRALFILVEAARTTEDVAALEQRIGGMDQTTPVVMLVRAALQGKRGDLAGAEETAKKALTADPKSPEAHAGLGSLLAARKDLSGASAELKAASDLSGPHELTRLVYPRFLLQTGEDKSANAYLEELAKQNNEFIPLWLLRAQAAANSKDLPGALKLLDGLFQLDSGNPEGRMLQGQLLLATGETDKAIDLFQRLGKGGFLANAAAPRLELARAFLRKGSANQAVAALQEAVKLQPDFPDAVLLLSELSLRQGDTRTATSALKPLVEKQPQLLPAQLLLAQAYVAEGNFTEAITRLQQQMTDAPQAFEPPLYLGIIYLQQNKPAPAREALEKAQTLTTQNLLASYYLLNLDIAEKKFPEALQRAEALTTQMPKAGGPQLLLALVHLSQKQMEPAEQALRKCIDLDPNLIRAYDLLVSLYVSTGQLEKARTQLETLLAQHPENTGALLTLGTIQERLDKPEQARDTYQKVLAASPNSAPALNNLAVLYADKLRQLDKAYEFATRARTIQPEDGSIADTLGWILYQRKEYQQAVPLLRESAVKLPDNPEIQYHLGMASYMTGQVEPARTALLKAAGASGEFVGKSDIHKALAMLGGGDASQAELTTADLEKALQQQPQDLVVRQRLAERMVKEGAIPKAAALWEEALATNPKLLVAVVSLAKLNGGPLHNPDKALDFAKKARALAPSDPEVANLAGLVAFQSGNFNYAYSLLQDAARPTKAEPEVLYSLALTAYNLGKVEEARRTMERLAVDPDPSRAASAKEFLKLTALETKPEEVAGQESMIEAALQKDAAAVPALMLEARLRVQSGQTAEAIRIYSGILARLPEFGPAQRRLAALYSDVPAQAQAAFEMATKARKSMPDDPETAQILAAIRYRRGEYTPVVQLLQESATKRPLDAKLMFYEGMARLQMKQPEGYQILSKALEAGLDGQAAIDAKQELAKKSTP